MEPNGKPRRQELCCLFTPVFSVPSLELITHVTKDMAQLDCLEIQRHRVPSALHGKLYSHSRSVAYSPRGFPSNISKALCCKCQALGRTPG